MKELNEACSELEGGGNDENENAELGDEDVTGMTGENTGVELRETMSGADEAASGADALNANAGAKVLDGDLVGEGTEEGDAANGNGAAREADGNTSSVGDDGIVAPRDGVATCARFTGAVKENGEKTNDGEALFV